MKLINDVIKNRFLQKNEKRSRYKNLLTDQNPWKRHYSCNIMYQNNFFKFNLDKISYVLYLHRDQIVFKNHIGFDYHGILLKNGTFKTYRKGKLHSYYNDEKVLQPAQKFDDGAEYYYKNGKIIPKKYPYI
jgi:hypothetical protein